MTRESKIALGQGTILLARGDGPPISVKKWKFKLFELVRDGSLRISEIPDELRDEFEREGFIDKEYEVTPWATAAEPV